MKKKIINLFIGILFIAGLSLLIYPSLVIIGTKDIRLGL